MTESGLNKDLASIFIASQVNRSLKSHEKTIKDHRIELGFKSFLQALKTLSEKYYSNFQPRVFSDDIVNRENVVMLIKERFSELIHVNNDSLIINVIPASYEKIITDIVTKSTLSYSSFIIHKINEVSEQIRNSESENTEHISKKPKYNHTPFEEIEQDGNTNIPENQNQNQVENKDAPLITISEDISPDIKNSSDNANIAKEKSEKQPHNTMPNKEQNYEKEETGTLSETTKEETVIYTGKMEKDKDDKNETDIEDEATSKKNNSNIDQEIEEVEKISNIENELTFSNNHEVSNNIENGNNTSLNGNENKIEIDEVNEMESDKNEEIQSDNKEISEDINTIETSKVNKQVSDESMLISKPSNEEKDKTEEKEKSIESINEDISEQTEKQESSDGTTEKEKSEEETTKEDSEVKEEVVTEKSKPNEHAILEKVKVEESKKRTISPTQQKRFQHIAVNLIDSIQSHRFSSPFLQAVNKKEAPDYYDVIYQPRDLKNMLKAIKQKTDTPLYTSIKELERDVMLMFANCIMYNQSNEGLVELTRSMLQDVINIFKLFEETEQEIK